MIDSQEETQNVDLYEVNSHILKPVIKELLRTEFCPNTLRLLVDKIIVTRLPIVKHKRKETYRLWLSDGEKAIQAVLKSDIHPFVTSRDICEGTYVEITEYELARGRRLKGDGIIAHLLINDLRVFAREKRPENRNLAYGQGNLEASPFSTSSTEHHDLRAGNFDELDLGKTIAQTAFNNYYTSEDDVFEEDDEVDLVPWYSEYTASRNAVRESRQLKDSGYSAKKRKYDSLSDPLRQIDSNLSSSPTKKSRFRNIQSPTRGNTASKPQIKEQVNSPPTAVKPLQKILRSIRVTPLADLTGSKASRNKVRDVCVVITSVDANIKRKGVDDIRQFRIMDLSTKKKVLFSTFVDPLHFMPPPGTIALLRSVTTHQWDGGSLNAYKRDCAGREWFFPNPTEIQGCDVSALQALWKEVKLEDSVDSS